MTPCWPPCKASRCGASCGRCWSATAISCCFTLRRSASTTQSAPGYCTTPPACCAWRGQCYPSTQLNADLLLAGVIVHDLSKVEEMDSDALGVVRDYTEEGLLLGHIVIGVSRIAQAAADA